jgi:nitrogen-specific signal transduction histidine kinase
MATLETTHSSFDLPHETSPELAKIKQDVEQKYLEKIIR